MSTVNSATSAATSQTRSQKDMDSLVGTRDDFLTILLAQLKHQDPLEPMKGTEFIDSITRLSSVEQEINQNSILEDMKELMLSQQNQLGSPVSYLDKDVEFNSQFFNVVNGKGQFSYDLDANANEVVVVIKTPDGKSVYTGEGSKVAGKNTFTWNVNDENGNPIQLAEYVAEVKTKSSTGVLKTIDTYTTGKVTGANFDTDGVALLINNIKIGLDNVRSVKSTATSI